MKIFGSLTSKGSIARTVIFSLGHFCIDITTNYLITGAPIQLIAISAMLSPLLNSVWYFLLDKYLLKTIVKGLKAVDLQ